MMLSTIAICLISTLHLCFGVWNNEFDKPVNFTCPAGQAISAIHSEHNNHYEDRRWAFECRSTGGLHSPCEWSSHYVNDLDKFFSYKCSHNGFICGMKSTHYNHHEDSRFMFKCCQISESKPHGGFKSFTNVLRRDVKDICAPKRARNCSELQKTKKVSGVYTIYPDQSKGSKGVKAYCDMKTDGGGWTVIQGRIDGSVNFERGWTEYENGFGNVNGEYWLGNKDIHLLTSNFRSKLRIELVDTRNNKKLAKYTTFKVGDAAAKYKLTVGGYSGNAGDALLYVNGMKFTTIDQDNDVAANNCALDRGYGAWWLRDCTYSCLNRKFVSKLHWKSDFKTSTMMIRKL